MNSYYHYLTMLNQFHGSFFEFVRDKQYGIKKWIQHVESWLHRGDSSQRIHLIKYENLHQDPKLVLKNLYTNLGLEFHENSYEESINISSFEKMKQSENFYKKFNPNTSLVFMRKGQVKETSIDDQSKQYIQDQTKHITNIIGQ